MAFSSTLAKSEGRLTYTPAGRVDLESIEVFTVALVSAARDAKDDGAVLVVDLSRLAFMISRGLRALTLAQREGAEIRLARPNEDMADILRISRYDKLFEVET